MMYVSILLQDYGVKQAPNKRDLSSSKSSLAPQLVELMKMLFNVETYKYLLFLWIWLANTEQDLLYNPYYVHRVNSINTITVFFLLFGLLVWWKLGV